jgi:hypothetical protein
MKGEPSRVPLWRRLATSGAGLMGGLALVLFEKGEPAVLIPTVFLALAALAIHAPRLGPQLFARAVWWANLGLGTILCLLGSDTEARIGIWLSIGSGAALLGIGRQGLVEAEERSGYLPAAHRASLLLLMVLAMADAQTFLLMGALELDNSSRGLSGLFMFAVGALFVVGFVGLYRLAPWGALVTAGTSLVTFVVVGAEVIRVDSDFFEIVLVLTVVQMLATAPMLIAMVSGRSILPPLPARSRELAAGSVVLLLIGVSLLRIAGAFDRL